VIVIHDAARPLVTPALLERTIDAAMKHGAAIAALQARDTVKRGDAGRVIRGTLPRDEIFLAQTPQAFRVGVLRDALAIASTATDATDEAMLAEAAGHHVHLVEGDPRNLKITTPEDMVIAEAFVQSGGARPPRTGRAGTGYDLHRLVEGRPGTRTPTSCATRSPMPSWAPPAWVTSDATSPTRIPAGKAPRVLICFAGRWRCSPTLDSRSAT